MTEGRSEELAKKGIRNYLEGMLGNVLKVDGRDAIRVREEIRNIPDRDVKMILNTYRAFNVIEYDQERDEIRNFNLNDLRLVCKGYIIGKSAKIKQTWKKEI